MPDIFYDSLDAVPEGLREAATEADGKLRVSVVAKSKLDEFRENNIKVSKERDDMLPLLARAKQILGTEDFDEAEKSLAELRQMQQQVKDGQLVANKSLDEAVSERTKQMRESLETQIAEKAREAKAWQEKFGQSDQKYRKTVIDRAVTDVVLDEESGVQTKALPDILSRAYGIFEVGDDGKLTAKKGGEVLYGLDGTTPMSPKEWLTALREEAPYFFRGSNGGGSGGGETVHAGMSAAELAKLDPVTRLQIANKEYGN